MIQVIRLVHPLHIKTAMLKDDIYKGMRSATEWSDTFIGPSSYYFAAIAGDNVVGLVELLPESDTSISYHGGTYKKYRGNTKEYITGVLEQVAKQCPDCLLWTRVPGSNIAGNKLAESMGCEKFAELPKADGKESLNFYRWK